MLDKNGFWSDNKILSYRVRHNLANTFRGPGKSYGRKFHIMDRALNKDETTLCLYREPKDLKFAKSTWIQPLISPDPEDKTHKAYAADKFKWTGDKYLSHLFYGKKPVASFMTLGSVNAIKQMAFSPNTCWVWMDEFIPIKYIKLSGIDDEGDAYQMIVDTIDHKYKDNRQDYGLPNIRCILYGNPVNGVTPLTEYFGIDPFKYGVYRPKKDVVVERMPPNKMQRNDPNYLKDVRNFQLSKDKLAYIKPVPKGAKPIHSIRIGENEHFYTFYFKDGTWYIEQTHKHRGPVHYGTLTDRRADELPITSTFGDIRKTLQDQALKCLDYYSDLGTKMNYLVDIVHPGI